MTILQMILAVTAGGLLYGVILFIAKGTAKFIGQVAKAPGKGVYKVWNVIKARKLIRLNSKKAKLVMKEDYKARLNTALNNPSYLEAAAVKKVSNKIEAIELRRKK